MPRTKKQPDGTEDPRLKDVRQAFVIKAMRRGLWKRNAYSTLRDTIMKRFKVAHATAERDIRDAAAVVREQFEAIKPAAVQDIVADLDEARAAAKRDRKHEARVAANRALAGIVGIDGDDKPAVTVDVGSAVQAALASMRPDFSKLTREEREQLRPVLHLLAKAAPGAPTLDEPAEEKKP